jgi:pimeloyl-ACP methyl ester carboxylesterase
VGSGYNDAFIAELDQSTWVASTTIQAPDNFAFDPDGEVISINSTGQTRMNDINASGTTYDGATALLQAASPVTSGSHSLYLSIFDQGDHILDSAVFIDNVRFETVANPATDCVPGAEQKQVPIIFVPGASGTKLLNSSGEVWPRSQDVFDDETDDFLRVLRLDPDGIHPFIPNDPNYVISTGDIIRLETVEDALFGFDRTADIYDKTVKTLAAAGYKENEKLFIYRYDWRLNNEGLATGLLDYIDQVRTQTLSDRVDILAHSQGGLVIRIALSRQESVGKVRRVVTLGSPILGATKILGLLEY